MNRPRLLDLFCGAGGCAMGYHRAGFDVTGVDREPQPNYPFEFVQTDAVELLRLLIAESYCWQSIMTSPSLADFAAIHASPPCQGFSAMNRAVRSQHPNLIDPIRRLLIEAGRPYSIENVEGAPLQWPTVMLCGTMFGLRVRRHRVFELRGFPLLLTPDCSCRNGVVDGRLIGHRCGGKVAPGRRRPPAATEADRRDAIGVPWMTGKEARQAIPPAYTEYLGRSLLGYLHAGVTAA